MSILTGPLTVTRFKVVGHLQNLEENVDWRAIYQERLKCYAFVEFPNTVENHEGWVELENIFGHDFQLNEWLYNQYAAFSLRQDRKSLPTVLFNATLERQCKDWASDANLEVCPRSVRRDIKEQLKDEWLRKAFPSVSVVDCLWDTNDGWLIISSRSQNVMEAFQRRFYRTFGLKLEPESIVTNWMESNPKNPENLGASNLSQDFYTWLLFNAENEVASRYKMPEHLGGDTIDVWIDKKVIMEGNNESVAVQTETPSQSVQTISCLRNGLPPKSLGLWIRRDMKEFKFTLDGPLVHIVSAKMPSNFGSNDKEELVYDRSFSYSELWTIVEELFNQFIQVRNSKEWALEVLPAIKEWVGADD